MSGVTYLLRMTLLLGVVGALVGCKDTVTQENDASVSSISLSAQSEPLRLTVAVKGYIGGCERLELRPRREGYTFYVDARAIYEGPADKPCPAIAVEYEEAVTLELEGLAEGSYTVNANGVTEGFELKGGGIFVESVRASVDTVDAQILEASPGAPTVRVGAAITGEFGDPCVDPRDVKQVREGDRFRLTLEATERIDVVCPPVGRVF